MDLRVEHGLPEVRLWFLSDDESRLVQVQNDRLIYNWRKTDESGEYPRFDRLRVDFIRECERFASFLEREGQDPIEADQVELTYVNDIPAVFGESSWSHPERYFRLWSEIPGGSCLPLPDFAQFRTQFTYSPEDEPIGRLHIEMQPRLAGASDTPIYRFQLIGRGAPLGDGLPGVLDILDQEHDWIVQSFTDITTKEMQERWQRER